MSSGFDSRSSRRHNALRNSTVTGQTDMAGRSAGAPSLGNSSRLRNSRIIERSSFIETARQGELFACLRHSSYGRQIDRSQQVTGGIVGQGVFANLYFFTSLSDHNHARFVGDVARGSWTRSLMQCQARNPGCPLLGWADQPDNLGGQLELKFMRPVRPATTLPGVFAMKSQFPSLRIHGNDNRQERTATGFGRIRQSFGRIRIAFQSPFFLPWH